MQDNRTQSHTKDLDMSQLDADTIAGLLDMLNWWKSQQPSDLEGRPVFKRDRTVTKTVRLNQALVEEAERYARKHKWLTGGTFSGLVEVLVWERLGRSPKHVSDIG